MLDREKVVERLQRVFRYFKSMLKVGYDGDAEIYREHRESVKMAIELLKEQEAAPVIQREVMNMLVWCCGSCGVPITNGDKFCRMCGKEVKWDA